jgi:uncharacterized UBP type Zn finger protein
MREPCEHFAGLGQVTPRADGCEACLAIGAAWTELRVCLTCGHVGCCEDSPHAHALAHFKATGHPTIAALERAQRWGWCYVHARYCDLPPERLPRRRSALATLFGRVFAR